MSVEVLADRVARDGPLDELDAVGWAVRLAKTLDGLHREGAIHGAVSPRAIRIESSARGSRGVLLGSAAVPVEPAYQSRERALGREPSADDDIWGVAATLYLALTGTPPWSADSPEELAERMVAAPPAPLAVFDVGDDDLQRVLDGAFHRDPMERTSTAAALRGELERWRADAGFAQLPVLEIDRGQAEHTAATRVEPARVDATSTEGPRSATTRTLVQEESSDSDGGQTMVKPVLLEDDEDDPTLLRQGPELLSAVAASAFAAPASAGRPGLAKPLPAAGRPAVSGDPLGGTVRMEPGEPGMSPMSPFDPSRLPDAGQDEDEDEDDLRTVMRMSPFVPHGSGALAAGAAGGSQPMSFPEPLRRPPDDLAPGLPVLHADDDSDDEMQTMLRDAPDLRALAAGPGFGGPVMTPHPAAGGPPQVPAGFGPPPAGAPAGRGFAPQGFGFGGQGGFPVPSGAFPPPVWGQGMPGGPMQSAPPGSVGAPHTPGAYPPQQMMQAPPPMAAYRPAMNMPSAPPGSGRTSIGLAIVVALLALILAAGATFLFLRSRGPGLGKVGIEAPEAQPGSARLS